MLSDNALLTRRDVFCDSFHGYSCLIWTLHHCIWNFCHERMSVRHLVSNRSATCSGHFPYLSSIHDFHRGEEHHYRANGKDNESGTVLSSTLLGIVTIGHISAKVCSISNISPYCIIYTCANGYIVCAETVLCTHLYIPRRICISASAVVTETQFCYTCQNRLIPMAPFQYESREKALTEQSWQ